MNYDFCLLRWGSLPVLLAGLLLLVGLLTSSSAYATAIFINEIHYDNASTDSDEGFEIAGPAGSNLSGWSLLFYNGNGGVTYGSLLLTGVIPDQQNGFGVIEHYVTGIQNGSADGFALVDPDSKVVQFLSYEGTLTATNGAATGITSTDVGVAEPSATPVGFSLQLAGFGSLYEDYSWTEAKLNSFGAINLGQSFAAQVPVPTPEPSTLMLFGLAGSALMLLRKRLIS